MSIIATANSSNSFKPVPAGLHLARCYRIIDLGNQKTEYMGAVKMQRKVMLQFEVWSEDENGEPTKTDKGEPMSISKNYSLTLADKATLRKDLQTWRGRDFTSEELRGFNLKNVLGVWAMLSVTKSTGRDGKEYINIGAVMPVPPHVKKAGLPEAHNEPKMYSIDEHDEDLFQSFSDKLRAKIMASPEFQRKGISAQPAQSSPVDDDSDIPF